MSWQAFVDTNLVGSGNFNVALISDHEGQVWAKSDDKFILSDKDFQQIISGFENSSEIASKGFFINDKKYRCIKADSRSLYGKATDNEGGVTIVKTVRTFLIGFYTKEMKPELAAVSIEELADQLIEANFVFYFIFFNVYIN